ncbi:MAG: immunoglobulin domain-containing protein, partial [Rhodoferax sp.]|nr:immunoglobulin domain-containing protein [Rhodoferax sp.]
MRWRRWRKRGGGGANTPIAPTITTQPAAQTVTSGQTASFSVAATGTGPLTYQWKKNGTDVTGATSSTYTTPATSSADNGASYSVSVSNSAGTVTSSSATLAVTAAPVAPVISTQPVNQSVVVGQSATFTVTATGGGTITYQWKKNGTD